MPNPKISTLIDAFAGAAIDTSVWSNVTGGSVAVLDTVNDVVTLAQPTVAGATNTFGSNAVFDATNSSIYAQVGAVPNGSGSTKTAFVLRVDTSNSVALRVESGIFKFTLQTTGTTTTTTLPTYDGHAHRWWRLREASGTWYADASPDGLTWTTLTSSAYSWAATAMTFAFQTSAGATETAGLVATLAHVNTRLGGPANPNWPLMEHGWGARWNSNGGDVPLDRYTDVSDRTRGRVSVQRGRQYEVDQVRAGEAAVTLADTDGVLDPTNAAGPYAGHIQPYQPYRIRAQWPATRNLLSQFQATGGDLGGWPLGLINQGNAGPATFSSTDLSASTVTSATAWQGGTVIQCSVPAGTPATDGVNTPGQILWTPQPNVSRLSTYTMQVRVRNITPGANVQVKPFIYGLTADIVNTPTFGSPVTLSGSATAPWTTLTLTATLGANAAYAIFGVGTAASVASTCAVQFDGWQVEAGGSASAWAVPGVWYPVYGGFVERYSPQWDMAGTYGTISPTCVDAFALLSQQLLDDALTMEIARHNPRFLYTMQDPQGSLQAADQTGNNPPAPLTTSKYGPGSLIFGTQITASDTANGVYTGSSNTVATISNPNPGANAFSASTYLSLNRAGIKGPANPTVAWTRMVAWRYTGGSNPTSSAYFWSSVDSQRGAGVPGGSLMYWLIDSSGRFTFGCNGPGGGGTYIPFVPGPTTAADGNWHLAIVSYSHANAWLTINLDGTNTTWGFNTAWEPTGLISDNLGAYVDVPGGGYSSLNFKGDISFCAEFPSTLTDTEMSDLYRAWKASFAGDTTDQRYSRILAWGGYTGPSQIQSGLTTSMGPASVSGQDAASALQAVVDTEAGSHFVARDGIVVFRSRSARYNASAPLYAFGENAAAGEYPYEDCQLDYDSTHLSNQITVTQTSTGQQFSAQDATSITNYFPRTLTRSVNSSSAFECQDAAGYLLSRYKQPALRVSAVKLHPSANPLLWPVVLSVELGTRVRVMRRPPAPAPPITVDCFVEHIAWDFDDTGEAWVTLQCSPADATPYAAFAAWHTTFNASTAAGVSSITVNASADTTNPLAAQLAAGQQIVLGQGTANQETVTVASVGATSPGWTTATITLTAATTKTHTAGDTICEPLPSGVTNPSTWDATTQFDACAFAY
ncbi:hypothetical protein [Streptomyces mobaraensis]|uniref:Uncharacterized protein n=1 Tax=Streptomyces mobaraensis TaxID=35621 RepID=A0A5N5WCQ3_STRMB|nr:hypothetical protein [Streptomyces mobaraensis]KAB7850118.1 hypothetical protein FRZ00_05825 [Streptomyces mobaraensis]